MRRIVSTLVPLAFAGATAVLPLACADGGTVDQGFQKQSGAGGAGGATAASVSQSASSSDAASTTTTGPSATATSATSTTSTSTTSSSTGGSCVDPGTEPNETEAKATFLNNITDCDGSGGQVDGVLNGPSDVDWYRYKASDTFGCTVDPTRDITAVGSIRICKFFECQTGTAEVTCPDGTVQASSPEMRPGCCSLAGFDADLNCNGPVSDDAQVYIRIDNPDQVACLPYQLAYHY